MKSKKLYLPFRGKYKEYDSRFQLRYDYYSGKSLMIVVWHKRLHIDYCNGLLMLFYCNYWGSGKSWMKKFYI